MSRQTQTPIISMEGISIPTKSRKRFLSLRSWIYVLLFLPSLLFILLFNYYPAVRSLVGAFTSWNGFSNPAFVGFQNFVQYFQSYTFDVELRNILLFVAGGVVISLFFPFMGAVLTLSLPTPFTQGFLKYMLVIPMVVPQVILINIWAYLLNPNDGLVDGFLSLFRVPAIQWFSNEHTALMSILFVGFPWVSSLGYLIFLAGLQNISTDIHDAAGIDGSTGLSRILHIDVPLLMPQIQLVVVLSGIALVQNIVPILLLTNGGPNNATMVPGLDMYQSAFQNNELGYGMAIGTILFLGMLILTSVVLRLLRPRT